VVHHLKKTCCKIKIVGERGGMQNVEVIKNKQYQNRGSNFKRSLVESALLYLV
jgi:hypothetical protein